MFLDVETIIRVIILHESNALYYSVLVQVQGMLNVHQTKKELLLNNNSEKKQYYQTIRWSVVLDENEDS